MEQLHDGLMAIMKAGKAAPFRQRYDMIAPVIGRTFDLEVILRQVVGPRLAPLPPDQRAAVGDAFRRYTIASYVANFDTYSGQRFEVAPVVRVAGSDRVVDTQIAAASGQGMFWTMLCGRRVADGRWSTYWWTASSAGWRRNDPKCAPCWPTAAAPGCSSACDRKPLTCPPVFCSSVAARRPPGHFSATRICPRRVVESWAACASPNLLAVLLGRRDEVGMLSNNLWVRQPLHDASAPLSSTLSCIAP